MTTIQRTVMIPDDHRVHIDVSLPRSMPVGAADIVMTVSPKRKKQPKKSLESLAGSLAGSKNFAGDVVALVRQWREEW